MNSDDIRNTHCNARCYTEQTEVIIHPHAYKHGLTEDQIRYAYANGASGSVLYRGTATHRRMATIGFDNELREIELVFVGISPTRILVIHADYAHHAFRREIRKYRRGRNG